MPPTVERRRRAVTDFAITPVSNWPPPRRLPSAYPGQVPSSHYLLVDDAVHPLRFAGTAAHYLTGDGSWRTVDALLGERGLPLMAERCGIATYGANRNPGTLVVKMEHYCYRSPGNGRVMPVLRGFLADAEALAAGLSSQGYFYADLALHDTDVVAKELGLWVNLADRDQVRVLHDSEGVGRWYPRGRTALGADRGSRPLNPASAYVTEAAALVPPGHATPVAFRTVPATGRRVPSMDPAGLWDVVLNGWDLRGVVAACTGIRPDPDKARNS